MIKSAIKDHRSRFLISLTRRLRYIFYAVFLVLCFSITAEKNQHTKKDSIDFEQKISDGNTVSDWRKQTNKAWIES
ncbi:hypothetical protein LEP1GSC021_3334 [Leptospira noguchii str. 1993005606]|uniref:Uncharacterized protein n=1 Tax=Leptospira noguchii str. 2007001578 TaxID=1049974 RepID=A0ABN0J5E8_9LEPT|nr:hypothetical protein [Leptospira noguchii]EMN02198.1 hypothetical protein LEP1GSC035_0137 [Leptospira noguchii str. 2007001578]EPE84008.1 hypothetical protein LEP1GSC021_3334 [Leptospira noguchii str. 1993005606]